MSQLSSLRILSLHFEVNSLAKKCDESIEHFKLNKKLFDSAKSIEISYPSSRPYCGASFPSGVPVDISKLKSFFVTGEYSDVEIHIEGYDPYFRSHKVLLSLWSVPFTKVSQIDASFSQLSPTYLHPSSILRMQLLYFII